MKINFPIIKSTFLLWCLIVNMCVVRATTFHVGVGHGYLTITQAATLVQAGDTILCHDATIPGGISISNLNGKEGNYIYLLADKNKSITIPYKEDRIVFNFLIAAIFTLRVLSYKGRRPME